MHLGWLGPCSQFLELSPKPRDRCRFLHMFHISPLFILSLPSFLRPSAQLSSLSKYKVPNIFFLTTWRKTPMGQSDCDGDLAKMQPLYQQHVVVMRHGERRDNAEPLWATRASRRWDPPLTEEGKAYAFKEGRNFLGRFNFPIHRVFVSPFLRCLQTANEVVSALCAVDYDPNTMLSSADVSVDPSKVKVSVECGLCEMMNSIAIRPEMAPKDGDFGFDVSRCEASLPAGTIDHSPQLVYNELPKWEETAMEARTRYLNVIKALADKYPTENLLLVTHGEGVGTAFSSFKQGSIVYDLDYCGSVHAKRPIFFGENQSLTASDFSYVGHSGILFSEPKSA